MKLLGIDTNAKTVKGQKKGFITAILYMLPWKFAGVGNVCPMAYIAKCFEGCLNTAGRGAFSNVQLARKRKTELFYAERKPFMSTVVDDVRRAIRKAEKTGATPLVRLNGTSDIRWETIPVDVDGVLYPNIMSAFPYVQFYDYTKIVGRTVPSNYDLTFSYSGVPEYKPFVDRAVAEGMRIAVVFRHRDKIPTTFMGMPVVDGDDTDIRHLDPKGVIVALYAKGKAKKDTTGFVVD